MGKTLIIIFILLVASGLAFSLVPQAFSHQSGCHRWHSCPSDSGSYVCGDLGYTSQCPSYYSAPKPQPVPQETPTLQTKTVKGTEFELSYGIIGGSVSQIIPDSDNQSIIINIISNSKGALAIQLPREIIDAKIGEEDTDYFVLVDGIETKHDEKSLGDFRVVGVEFPVGAKSIEIIGTYVIPEFGAITVLILSVSIIATIVLSKTKLNLKF